MQNNDQANLSDRDEYIAFCVRDEEYCIGIKSVREIRRWTSATRLPHAPGYVIGVINLRGSVLPVIDFASRLGLGKTEATERHTIIIIEASDQTIGLLVDTVSDILTVGEENLQPTPAIASEAVHEIVTGLVVMEERMLRAVNVGNIAPRIELSAA